VLLAESLPIHFSDNSIVDGARISFAKRAEMFSDEKNIGLMKHLAKHGHWSPYGHARETFEVVLTDPEALFFFENAKLAGFSWIRDNRGPFSSWWINGSLWAWYENIRWMPLVAARDIATVLWSLYPQAAKILFNEKLIYWDPPAHDRVKLAMHRRPADSVLNAKINYVSLRLRAPIWVARQLVKHQVHLCWNEESRRYITDDPTYFMPELRRKPPESVKQGSSDELIDQAAYYSIRIEQHHAFCDDFYKELLAVGAAAEVARGVLPLNVETNWVWTGSLSAWDRVCRERIAPGAQKETRLLVEQIENQINPLFNSWKELRQMSFPPENAPAWQLP
jgi:thymidylate synthase (FAD)